MLFAIITIIKKCAFTTVDFLEKIQPYSFREIGHDWRKLVAVCFTVKR